MKKCNIPAIWALICPLLIGSSCFAEDQQFFDYTDRLTAAQKHDLIIDDFKAKDFNL